MRPTARPHEPHPTREPRTSAPTVSPQQARSALRAVSDAEAAATWHPHPAALAICALAVGILYFCGLMAPVRLVLVALAGMVVALVVCMRWIQRPGLRHDPLTGPELSRRTIWPCLSLVLLPSLLLPLRGELHGASGTLLAVVLSALVAALTIALFADEARRA